jgi:ADP-heptose:LPS heptosyltransferase
MPVNDCPENQPAADAAISFTPRRDPFAPGLLQEMKEPPRRIVILRASRIGDFINGSPAFHALRSALPEAEISLITLPMLRGLAERLGIFQRILDFPGYPGLAEQFFAPERALAFLSEMQAQRFDLAIQMQGSGVYSNPFVLMLGAQWTAGFIRPGDPPGRLDAALPFPNLHEAHRNLALIEFLGIPAAGNPAAGIPAAGIPAWDFRTRFPLWPEDVAAAERLLRGAPRPWIGIHTSARDRTRRWPLARFAAAAAGLQRKYGGTLVLIGEARDQEEMQSAVEETGAVVMAGAFEEAGGRPQTTAPFRNLAGCTTLPVTGAVIRRLAVFLTNDTGPAHIAYALQTPTVAIFGGGDPQRNGPIGGGPFRVLAYPVDCRPCESGDCPIGFHCLEQISVEQVIQAASEIITL